MDRDVDRSVDRDQTRERDRDLLGDKDRDQDRIHQQDRDRIYAVDLMTAQERTEYQNQLRTLATEQSRIQYRLEQQATMQARARQNGSAAAPATLSRSQIATQERARQQERQQIYGYALMSQGELDQYREQLRQATTVQAREKIRAEHRKAMSERSGPKAP